MAGSSQPNAMSIGDSTATQGSDPLTPIERMILDLLLKKQARAESAAGIQSTTPKEVAANIVSNVVGPKSENADSTRPGPSKMNVNERKKVDGILGKLINDDMSEGPLDDDLMDQLMQEYGGEEFEMGESDDIDDEDYEPTSEETEPIPYKIPRGGSARGRGGRGTANKAARGGRGRTAPVQIETPSELDDFGDGDASEELVDDNDPVSVGASYMAKMSDNQITQYIGTFKEETKYKPSDKLDTNGFLAWLSNKLQSLSLVPSSPPAPSPARGHKVMFEEPPTTSRGGGRGRGRANGGRGRGGTSGGRRRRSSPIDSEEEFDL